MQFRILGSLAVVADDGAPAELGPPKQRALLAGLILHVGEIVPVDRLIELLWGAEAPRTAAHSIQIYVSELRKALAPLGGAESIVTRPPGYLLEAERESVDAWRFERLVRDGARLLEAGEGAAGRAALAEALGLWRGPVLSDFTYEEFAQPAIGRLNERHLEAIEILAAAELEAGRPAEVIHLLEGAVREDPLRERSRELLMLALYRAGRHADALRTYDALRTGLADELGVDPSPPIRALYDRILLHDPSLLPAAEATGGPEVRNPYKGLRAFTETDAPDFFGRDELVGQLLDALRAGRRLVALVGPSGSGKSSVVAAGLVPRLREGALEGSGRWHIVRLVPGAGPLREVAALGVGLAGPVGSGDPGPSAATAGAGHPSLLVIDQFEQLFSVAEEPARNEFLAALAGAVTAPDATLRVVLTLRADFYDRPLLHPAFAAVFGPGVVNVVPMTAHELEAAVVEPARRVGVEVEPALLAELVADTADRPGSLPLLQYALTELFEQRAGPSLGQAGYAALGGLRGLLSRRAEAIYGGLGPEAQDAVLQVLLRLVRVGGGAAESRRRTPLGELTDLGIDPVTLSEVLTTFGRHRLLTFDRDEPTGAATVELAHEALLTEWERLAGWIERHRADLRRHATLAAAAEEWEESGHDPDYLLAGSRLEVLGPRLTGGVLRLGGRERAFLEASLERRDHVATAEAERRGEQRRSERQARLRLTALGAAVIVLGFGLAYAVVVGLGTSATEVALLANGEGVVYEGIVSGFDRAVSDFGLVGRKVELHLPPSEVAGGALERELRQLSEDPPALIVVFDLALVDPIARDFPDARYLVFDTTGGEPNVAYAVFRQREGAYLAGAAAAMTTTTGTIGFVGGWDGPPILEFAAGYEAGASAARPDIRVLAEYLAEFGDFEAFSKLDAAEAAALRMYEQGADVVFHAAGGAGLGVFQAAADYSDRIGTQVWAIGVDSDQYETVRRLPGATEAERWQPRILTSVLKRYDTVVYEALRDVDMGRTSSGQWIFGLGSGIVDLSYSGGFIDDLRPRIEAYRSQILDGAIEVPCVPEDLVEMAEAIARENGLTFDELVAAMCP